jgi:GT2 family glycosyltransferase
MTRRYSIASVTVAHNGAAALPRQLDAIKKQTHPLDEIIVVNNASSDNSERLLARDFPEITTLNQPSNIGVGGGFSAGLEYATNQKKYDWIWLLDQDSLPSDDCLQRLLEALGRLGDKTDDVGILAPVCANENAKLSYLPSLWQHGLRKRRVNVQDQPVSFVDSVISSGTLLRSVAVEEIGLPRSDFFMDFVDHEYCLRLRRHAYKIAVVQNSRIEHTIGDPRIVNILGYEKAWSGHIPWREYYMTRNEIFTVWKYDSGWRAKFVTAHRLLRHATAILLFGEQKVACLSMMYRGFADGRAGRLGIRVFDPKESSSAAT